MNIRQKYMSRAIEIARNGRGTTAPNPSVGAVLVHSGKIIGEGFTSAFGGAHAEVNAIASVVDKTLLRQSTLYVTLEPCSHFGKTPPCADLIVEHKIPQVVVGILDPHKKVAGRGLERLRKAGVKVSVGILEAECREHHKRFLTFHGKNRPYIILKWAETADGFIAPEAKERLENAQPYWISNSYSRQLTHK
ncbi:MAG: bifunctional diaminohydroxyphosphoribosylaminopyrimidine deaminase/5-amino-6-(5-phosphoribosylamino)uracil reductase RibD, partial [Pricia sp.]